MGRRCGISPLIYAYQKLFAAVAFIFVASEAVPNACRESSAHERTNDENPQLRESLTACEYSGSDTASRINGGTGVTDADEVYENESQTDCKTSKITGTFFFVGRTENYEYEDEREYDFSDESRAY